MTATNDTTVTQDSHNDQVYPQRLPETDITHPIKRACYSFIDLGSMKG